MSQIAIIGGGHNGLTAAIALAKGGHDVVVYEAQKTMGGLAARHEFGSDYAVPGLLTDTSTLRWDIAKKLGLEGHGLKAGEEIAITIPNAKEEPIVIFSDRLSGVSNTDQDAYRDFIQWHESLENVVRDIMNQPAISPKDNIWTLLKQALAIRGLGADTLTELLRVAPMCIADWMRDTFENERLRAALALPSLTDSFSGPWSAGTATSLLLKRTLSGKPAAHGAPMLIEALIGAAKDAGVTLQCSSRVAKITIDNDKVTGLELEDGSTIKADSIFSSIDPKQCFLNLLGAHKIPMDLAEDMQKFRSRGTVALLHLGMNAPLTLSNGTSVSRLRTVESLDRLEQAFDPLKYGLAATKPALDVKAWSCDRENLGPKGHTVVSAMIYCAPEKIKGGWTKEARSALKASAIDALEVHCPSIRNNICASELLTPADLSEQFLLTGGHLMHGEQVIDQMLFMRPSVDCAHYGTPLKGLFLCGSGSHPGGGLTLAPGWLAAQAYLRNH